jgi:hypothetical protein
MSINYCVHALVGYPTTIALCIPPNTAYRPSCSGPLPFLNTLNGRERTHTTLEIDWRDKWDQGGQPTDSRHQDRKATLARSAQRPSTGRAISSKSQSVHRSCPCSYFSGVMRRLTSIGLSGLTSAPSATRASSTPKTVNDTSAPTISPHRRRLCCTATSSAAITSPASRAVTT